MPNFFTPLVLLLGLYLLQASLSQTTCPKGQFLDSKIQACQNCAPGTFTPEDSSISECQACPEGSYAPEPGSSECQLCPAGTYEEKRTSCHKCYSGTYSAAGSKSESDCIKCPEGTIAPDSGSAECQTCAAGTYEMERFLCMECDPGTISKAGSKSEDDCIQCPAGSIGNSYTGATECKQCPAGTWEDKRTNCFPCPGGTYSGPGTKSRADCIACPAGSVSPLFGGAGACTTCDAGTYEENRSHCYSCPAGTSSKAGVSGSSGCIACSAGYIAAEEGSAECKKCAEGTYEINGTSCAAQCPAGTFIGNPVQCSQCPSGTISKAGASSCEACPEGKKAVNSGTECKAEKEDDVVPGDGNNMIWYLLGVAIVAVLVFVGITRCNKKQSNDFESEREATIGLVHQSEKKSINTNFL